MGTASASRGRGGSNEVYIHLKIACSVQRVRQVKEIHLSCNKGNLIYKSIFKNIIFSLLEAFRAAYIATAACKT